MIALPEALMGLAGHRQFIPCSISERNGKKIKVPLDYRTMRNGSIMDPGCWMSFDECSKFCQTMGPEYRIGFVFTEQDPFFFLDIDKCIERNQYNAVANWAVQAFAGAAVELSQSGTGLHIIGTGVCPEHSCKNIQMGVELYTQDRFVMLTGTAVKGNCLQDCSAALPTLVNAYFQPKADSIKDQDWSEEPVPEWDGPPDDEILIAKACKSRSAGSVFGGKATFEDLWTGNEKALQVAFPHDSNPWDYSSADASLAQHLAFWTGNNHARILRLMWQSGLKREKWEDRGEYYLPRTILNACSRQTEFYNKSGAKTKDKEPAAPIQSVEAPSGPRPTTATYKTGVQYMSPEEQVRYFEGLVYVADLHQIFDSKSGYFYKPEKFRVLYGGYHFAMDGQGGKTIKNAWEAFTENQAISFPKVYSIDFDPSRAAGDIVDRRGLTYVNTYIPPNAPRVKGDPSLFLQHLAKLLPNETDRTILLSYLAGVLQYPGTKFQYCPVIQGAEGNGKSAITFILEYGLGDNYVHRPNAADLAGGGAKFNSWLSRKLLISVDEIHIPNKPGGLLDALKPLITNTRVEIQGKGLDQFTGDNRANWILQCNRKTDVPVTVDARRYCIFFTAQQSKVDCLRDGLDDAYWQVFWKWMKEQKGREVVATYLMDYDIPDEYNPSLLSRAPSTSSTAEAQELSVTEVDQLVHQAIDDGVVGFRGGWVSSHCLELMLERHHQRIPPNQVRLTMQNLGFDWHPSLHNGRLSAALPAEENKRPVLYIPRGHINQNISTPGEVVKAYCDAQGYVPSAQVPGAGYGNA